MKNTAEIERKFLVNGENLDNTNKYVATEMYEVNQKYLVSDNNSVEIRIREVVDLINDVDSVYTLTIKYDLDSSNDKSLVREEIEKSISIEEYQRLSQNSDRELFKVRTKYKCIDTGMDFIVDYIPSTGEHLLEVEFDSVLSSEEFQCPEDWGEVVEVTSDPKYRAYNMSEKYSPEPTNKSEDLRNSNEFLDLINSPVLRMDNVIRFSGLFQITQELLSSHVVDVQFVSLLIARKLINLGESVDTGLMLEKCLVHDVDEVLVGDIPRLTKYSSPQCYKALNAVADGVVVDMSIDFDGTTYLYDLWRTAKDYTIEGYLLKLSDMIVVAKKCVSEVEMLNNNNFLRVAIEMLNYVNDLLNTVPRDLFCEDESSEYIKDILRGVIYSLSSIIEDRSDIISRYAIENSATKDIISNRYKEELK